MENIVRLVQLSDLFIPESFPLKEGLPGRPATAHFALMRFSPYCRASAIHLNPAATLSDFIEFPPECNLIKLVQNRFRETIPCSCPLLKDILLTEYILQS